MLSFVTFVLLLQAAPLDDNLAFQEGMRLSEQFEYEKAIFRFREAARDPALGLERATVLVWLGLTYAKVGEQSAADEAFFEAVRVDPLVALPPSTPPKILEALEAARRRLREERNTATTPNTTTPTTTTPTSTTPTTTPTSTTPTTTPTSTTPTTTPTAGAAGSDVGEVAPPEQPPDADAGSGVRLVVGGGAIVGVGLLTLGGGVGLGLSASLAESDAAAAVFQDDRQRLNEDAATQATLANICYGIGAAVAVGGIAVLAAGLAGGAP